MRGNESLRALGDEILRDCPGSFKRGCIRYPDRDVWYLEVPQFTRGYMDLHREMHRLSPDGSCLGAALFRTSTIPCYDREGNITWNTFRANTVLIDPSTCHEGMFQQFPGRYRFTEMHEVAHHILVRNGFYRPAEPALFRYTGRPARPEEREADYLAAYLLMPDSVLLAMMQWRDFRTFTSYEGFLVTEDRNAIRSMAEALKVSYTALSRRLADAGWIEYRSIWEFHDPADPHFHPAAKEAEPIAHGKGA